VRVIFINIEYVGGAAGFPGIPYQKYTLYYAYGVVLILILFFRRLQNSRMGRAMRAVGDDETAAEINGVNITSTKLKAFTAGAFIAGIGGGILAHFQEFIEPLMFGVMHSVEYIVFAVFGGVQVFWGPIFGAFVLTFMPEFFREVQAWRMELYGLLLIIMMILKPEGVITHDMVRYLAKRLGRS
jgi:branched-chain amino acid transport system permease protein